MTKKYQKLIAVRDVQLGKKVHLSVFVNLYGCRIGDYSKIGSFVEIQKNVLIGNNCKISSHSFICSGVIIGKGCFIGHGVMFINDNYPQALNSKGKLEKEMDWRKRFVKTTIENFVSIGSNSTILGNVKIGTNSLIGAGSVVIGSIPPNQVWAGNPARFIRVRSKRK